MKSNKEVDIDISMNGLPLSSKDESDIESDLEIVSNGLIISSAMLLNLIIFLSYILYEKGNNLLVTLRMIGMYESAYWWSYFIISLLLSIILSFVYIVTGLICGLVSFKYVEFNVLYLTYFLSLLSIFSFGTFCSSFVPSHKVLNFLLYIIIYLELVLL